MDGPAMSLLLDVCGACLNEVACLKKQIKHAVPTFLPECEETGSLDEICLVKDEGLKEILLRGLKESGGSIGASLSTLKHIWEEASTIPRDLADLLISEHRQGHILVVGISWGESMSLLELLQSACETEGDENVTVWPKFEVLNWRLLSALVQRCEEQSVDPPLDLLGEALRQLVSHPVSNVDIIACAASRHSGLRTNVVKGGRAAICSKIHERDSRSFSLFCAGLSCEEAEKGEAERALTLVASHDVQEVVQLQMFPNYEVEGGHLLGDTPGLLLFLLGVLGHLADDECSLGAILWALESSRNTDDDADFQASQVSSHRRLVENGQDADMRSELSGMESLPQDQILESPDVSPRMRSVCEAGNQKQAGSTSQPRLWGQDPRTPVSQLCQERVSSSQYAPGSTNGGASPSRGSNGGSPTSSNVEIMKRAAQARFVACFMEDLLSGRQLFLKQINNLYLMRSRGAPLQYKSGGYRKLQDFIMEVPGLDCQGSGNHLEVIAARPEEFRAFCRTFESEGLDVMGFDKPQQVSEVFQRKVVELFESSGCAEITEQEFCQLWGRTFPNEALQCKDLGYRDLRGLLRNTPVIEQVRGTQLVRYSLKTGARQMLSSEGGSNQAQVLQRKPPQAPPGNHGVTPGALAMAPGTFLTTNRGCPPVNGAEAWPLQWAQVGAAGAGGALWHPGQQPRQPPPQQQLNQSQQKHTPSNLTSNCLQQQQQQQQQQHRHQHHRQKHQQQTQQGK